MFVVRSNGTHEFIKYPDVQQEELWAEFVKIICGDTTTLRLAMDGTSMTSVISDGQSVGQHNMFGTCILRILGYDNEASQGILGDIIITGRDSQDSIVELDEKQEHALENVWKYITTDKNAEQSLDQILAALKTRPECNLQCISGIVSPVEDGQESPDEAAKDGNDKDDDFVLEDGETDDDDHEVNLDEEVTADHDSPIAVESSESSESESEENDTDGDASDEKEESHLEPVVEKRLIEPSTPWVSVKKAKK